MTVYVNYTDQGPAGICGQSCDVTNPWNRLYIFDDYDTARQFMESLEGGNGRLHPRVKYYWDDLEGFQQVFDQRKSVP